MFSSFYQNRIDIIPEFRINLYKYSLDRNARRKLLTGCPKYLSRSAVMQLCTLQFYLDIFSCVDNNFSSFACCLVGMVDRAPQDNVFNPLDIHFKNSLNLEDGISIQCNKQSCAWDLVLLSLKMNQMSIIICKCVMNGRTRRSEERN